MTTAMTATLYALGTLGCAAVVAIFAPLAVRSYTRRANSG